MKKQFLFILLLLLSISFSSKAQVQDSIDETELKEIVFLNNLRSIEPDKGRIQIFQDPRLLTLMEVKASENKENTDQDFIIVNGYRVQVYSSNTPQKSKTEAFKIETDIKEKHPEIGTYVSFTSPFWKVRVGDCNTYQEAFSLAKILKSEFPNIKNDIYIIKENIRIPVK